MFNVLALFTILALSFASQGWVGTWQVSNLKGQVYCVNGIIPSPLTNVTISVLNDTSLLMNGTDMHGQPANWTLPWGQYANKYEDCGNIGAFCIKSSLQVHGGVANGKITYYCSYGALAIYRTYTLSDLTTIDITSDLDDEFLSIIS